MITRGGKPLDLPSVCGSITQKRVAMRVSFCEDEPSQMIPVRLGKAATNRFVERKPPYYGGFFLPSKSPSQPF